MSHYLPELEMAQLEKGCAYHGKAVSKPQSFPVLRTVRDVHVLAMHRDHVRLHLADNAPADKGLRDFF